MIEKLENILHRVSKSPLIDMGELISAYSLVIESLQEGLEIKRAGVWFVESNYSSISCQLLIDTHHNTKLEELIIHASDYPMYFDALKSERVIVANDAHQDIATSEFSNGYLDVLGITSMLDVPIRHKGKMIGIICCEHIGDKREWTRDEATFAGSMADLIGRAINANAFIKSENQLRLINEELEQTISERTKQLVESEKMAALGNLVAGVAHEVNTPLGICITAGSSMSEAIADIKNSMDKGKLSEAVFLSFIENSNKLIALLESNLDRAAELVQNFKETAVDHTDQNHYIFDVNQTIKYLINSLKPETNKREIDIKFDVQESLSIHSFPSAWTQIVTNLIMNSCKHAFQDTENPTINIKTYCQGDNVCLQYQDNGCGIEEDNLSKVIIPFYTTKRGKGGSGLGMSIVYNLIYEQLKGKMKIANGDGEGLQVTIVCPLEFLQTKPDQR